MINVTQTGILALLFLHGCASERSGTSVGNPGKMTGTAGSTSDVVMEYLETYVTEVAFTDCEGEVAYNAYGATADLLSGFELPMPAGEICGVELLGDGLLFASGYDAEGTYFTANMTIEERMEVKTNYGFFVDGEDFVYEIGAPGWLDSATLNLGGLSVDFMPEDQVAMDLAERVEKDVALFEDSDGDGQVNEAERSEGAVASAAVARGEEDDSIRPRVSGEGARCTASPDAPSQAGWLILGALFGLARRRHR